MAQKKLWSRVAMWCFGVPSTGLVLTSRFSREDVAQKNDPSVAVWVTYRNEVYDVTKFDHPGGREFLGLAAGGPVDPFFDYWAMHLVSPKVPPLLKKMKIGELNDWEEKDVDDSITATAAATSTATSSSLSDTAATPTAATGVAAGQATPSYYADEPVRDSSLIVLRECPFSSMTDTETLFEAGFLTPADKLFVRNHAPVPHLSQLSHSLRVVLPSQPPRTLPMQCLESMKQQSVTSMLQCAGNRGGEAPSTQPDSAFAGIREGMAGNVQWEGVPLRDLLAPLLGPEVNDTWHVHLQGADGYCDSVPLHHILAPASSVLLATRMNGLPLSPDHGAPLRVIIPGVIGARNVKWLSHLEVSPSASPSPWQQHYYLVKGNPILKMPLQSMILSTQPLPSSRLDTPQPASSPLRVKGVAWGAGAPVSRVEVCSSITVEDCFWHHAKLLDECQQAAQAWAWQRWSCDVTATGRERIWCRAYDSSGVCQPQNPDNGSSYLYNGWHNVPFSG